MIIGIPKEIKQSETRVGATPQMVQELISLGHKVLVETKAGAAIGFTDDQYKGAHITDRDEVYTAEMIVKVKEPQEEEFPLLKSEQILFCYLHLAAEPKLTKALLERNVTAIAYETVTGDEGTLPLLVPMSEIAGRLSVHAGAIALQGQHGGKGVLLACVPGVNPAKVLVIGGGVSGTEAIKSGLGIGADVTVLETKPERRRELKSMFEKLHVSEEPLEKLLPKMDLVIGAVLAKGQKAPHLITREMLRTMEKGSAFVDISIDQGGISETSRPTQYNNPTYVEEGVVHYCVSNMPGGVGRTATEALTRVTADYVKTIASKGVRKALLEDKNLLNGLNVYRGGVTCEPVAHDLGYPWVSFS